jgi:hypothetical protein
MSQEWSTITQFSWTGVVDSYANATTASSPN